MAYLRRKIIVEHQFGEPEPDWIEEPVNSYDHIWSGDACRSVCSLWLSFLDSGQGFIDTEGSLIAGNDNISSVGARPKTEEFAN
jgi:hypothetical protein